MNDINAASVGYGNNGKLIRSSALLKKRKATSSKKGKKSAWSTKAKQLKQEEEKQQDQMLLLHQQEEQIKVEEEQKSNARMGSVGFLESKEEIFAKKLHLGNRIRAAFGASGDHDAVERMLGKQRTRYFTSHANGI